MKSLTDRRYLNHRHGGNRCWWRSGLMRALLIFALDVAFLSPPGMAAWWDRFFPGLGPPTGRPRGPFKRGGNCPLTTLPITPLMPNYRASNGRPLALSATAAATPTLWLYLPYALTPDRPAELRQETPDPNDPNYRQQTTVLRLDNVPAGIVGVRSPIALAANQRIDWQLVVLCDAKDASTNQFVTWSMVRLPLPLELFNQLQPLPPRERSRLYANAGLWSDAVTTLADRRRQVPDDPALLADWQALLSGNNLADLTGQPIVQYPGDQRN